MPLSIGRFLNWIVAPVIAVAAMHFAAPVLLAHDESIHCSIDMVIEKDKVTVELHFPIAALLGADAWSDQTNPNIVKTPKDVKDIDRDAYVKTRAEMLANGLRIRFDATELAPKVTEVSADDLVIGVSLEDTTPKPVGVYKIEYTPEKPIPSPALVTVNHDFLPQPNDGSVITVVCLINRKQADRKALFPMYISNDDRMTMKLEWAAATSQPATAPASAPARSESPPWGESPQIPAAFNEPRPSEAIARNEMSKGSQ